MREDNGPGIWSHAPDESHSGICISKSELTYSLSEGSHVALECDRHGVDLGRVSELPDLTIRGGYNIGACPECFENERELQSAIKEDWDRYQTAFIERTPPGSIDPQRDYLR